jgi:poly(A) polymerase
MGSKRKPLKTSREIHDRIQWDPSLDERAFVVVYEERFTGRRPREFTGFPTDGEIPWHRVWEYRVDELVVWSREGRIDLLFGSGDTERARLDEVRAAIERWRQRTVPGVESLGASPGVPPLEALAARRYDFAARAWVAAPAGTGGLAVRLCSLVVVTLNVLFDLYDEGSLHTAQRIPAMLELLCGSGADLIALQEVTPRTLQALLAAPWVQRGYEISDGPEAATVEPYGVVLLSRLPMRAFLRRAPDGGRKRTVVAVLELAEGPLNVAVVHLTSDRGHDAAARRSRELGQALRDLDGLGPAPGLLLGDLNADDGPLDRTLHAAGFVDLWSTLRPDEDGATFDPHTNSLARLASRSGRARRLDRIMLRRGEGTELRPLGIVRIGTRPTARDPEDRPLPASDHYGLRARLRVEGGSLAERVVPGFRPTHHSALVVIPPRGMWPAIEAIRREHDRAVSRWMPHVNLLYGFAPAEQLAAAARVIEAVLAEVPPFRVTFERLRCFARRGGATVWLEPRCDPPDALQRLQAALFECFPQCDEQSRKSSRGYVPHLTVGQLREPEVEAMVARWQADWVPISFTVDALALIHRGEQGPFAVRRIVSLGAGSPVATLPELPSSLATLVGQLSRAWCECFEEEPRVREASMLFVAGSHRLGVAEPAADLDLVGVALRRIPRATMFERLTARLRAQGIDARARIVDGAAPRLALRVAGRDVDLQHVAWPDARPWPTSVESLAECHELDAESEMAVLALCNADALLEHAARHGGQDRYREALRGLRRWAAARDVDDNALGYPGGLAWAVMLAAVAPVVPCDPTDEDPARTLVDACMLMLARRTAEDWRCDPIALGPLEGERALEPSLSPMIVLEPAACSGWHRSGLQRNCMRRATATTLRVLMAELADAAVRLDRGESAAELATSIDPCDAHSWVLVVELQAGDDEARGELEGFVHGRAAGFIRALERTLPADGPVLRPYRLSRVAAGARGVVASRLVIGLDAPGSSQPSLPTEPLRELERAVMSWERCPAGAKVRLAVWSAAKARASVEERAQVEE